MSIYSGFATRHQEHKYNNLIETLVIALKKRIMKFYAGENCDEQKFKVLIKKVYKKMYVLEKGKFMAPKYSTCFLDLIQSLNIEINYDSISDASSMMSQTFSLRKQSIEHQNQQFKSNTILLNKKNLLEVKPIHTIMNSSAFSLNKPNHSFQIENEEEEKRKIIPRSTSLDVTEDPLKNNLKHKGKLRQLQELKDLRGTMHMPKVQDFLPKKEEIQPGIFVRRNNILEANPQKNVFRRGKYSRQDINVEEI